MRVEVLQLRVYGARVVGRVKLVARSRKYLRPLLIALDELGTQAHNLLLEIRRLLRLRFYLTQSVSKVVLQRYIPTQIRQPILYISNSKGRNLLLEVKARYLLLEIRCLPTLQRHGSLNCCFEGSARCLNGEMTLVDRP